ncbi:MAG: FAD-linked oxidase C-terminal domain-containing protein [Paracoccus aminovorans]|nr:FAD-linked oxidase C-terminal domain-containing protein [Paracoccus aminovorans]
MAPPLQHCQAAQLPGIPPTRTGSRHPNRPAADDALTINPDHSVGAVHGCRHLCLEGRTVVPARSSSHGLLLARSIMLPNRREIDPLDQFLARLIRGKSTYPGCSDFRSHLYGHVDVGCLHIRPALNIDSPRDRARLVAVSDAVFALTRQHGGIFWGEHGKGLRGAYLREWIGPEAYAALQGVKAAFDPSGRFNPGKLVSNGGAIMGIATTPFRDFNAPEGDALERAFRCNGNAQCLSYAAATPMCPSFKATADLRHSPKGRADALRAWHKARQEEGPDLPRREADLRAVFDTCLSCKACASACPVQVDIPTMRAAFLADYFARHARPMADRLILAAERFSPLALRFAPVLAPLWPLAARLAECLTGSRDLPRRIARLPRDLWLDEADLADALPEGSVILVQDWFTALFDGRVQHQVIAGLRVLGYRPRLLRMRPAGNAAQGAGDRAGFEAMARTLVRRLDRAAATGAPLVAFEPAFAMMLRQDYPRAGFAPPPVLLPQEFLSAEARRHRFPQARAGQTARLLSHCTEATGLPEAGALWARVFQALGIQVQTPATGCCGMAGLFGHQNRHQAMSRKLFDLSWREHLESGETVLATGFSCRCQAERLSGRVPGHPLGLIAKALR